MKDKKRSAGAVRALTFFLRVSPFSFIFMLIVSLLYCGNAVLGVFLTGRLFSFFDGGAVDGTTWSLLALYALYLFTSSAYSFWYTRYAIQFRLLTAFERRVINFLHKKSDKISNEMLERPDAYYFIRRADAARQSLFRFGEINIKLCASVVQTLLVTAYVSSFNLWFIVFLPLGIIPPVAEKIYSSRLWGRLYERQSELKIREKEYEKSLTEERSAAEIRLTGAARLLEEKLTACRKQSDELEIVKCRRLFILRLAMSLIQCIGNAAGLIVPAVLLMLGRIDLSSLAAASAAYVSLLAGYRMMFDNAAYSRTYLKMLQPFFNYADMPERRGKGKCPVPMHNIELKDISFVYPNAESAALDKINLTIEAGKVYAVVGENGAGKSTLAGVILGLLKPSGGKVFYDGNDISLAEEDSVHSFQSAVFQNFNRYKMTVADNIAIGNFNKCDQDEIARYVKEIFKDTDGNALLGKEFGGVDISGGEWQKLACARGFYADGKLIVLDEPTAAIDPLREKQMFDLFAERLNGRTGIIITHRLGAVKLCDEIIVLSHGHLAGFGAHDKLLAENEEYARLWNSQAGMLI